jgi:SSS family solute:Na+ symporter
MMLAVTNFTWIDGVVVLAYLATLVGIGVYFSRRQKGIESFFLAGRGMGWLPIGLSLMAALNSGIDYLMQPSSTIRYGLVLLAGSVSWLLLYPWVSRVVLPFYRQLESRTAYEFLEARFDVRVRLLAAAIFVGWRLGWMATAIYVPCLAVEAVTGGAVPVTTSVVVLGVLVTAYTMLGGITAVIWNDVMQFFIMFGGLAATVWISASSVPGGMAEIWAAAHAAGAGVAAPAVSAPWLGAVGAFFLEPLNITSVVVAITVGRMAGYTSDQVMVQRFQATRSLGDARRAFVINAAGDVLWMFGLSFVGLALLAYFTHHPLPPAYASDKIVPYFMSLEFPVGAVGLVIAAILAASLSSVDSAINSATSVLVIDFYNRLSKAPPGAEASAAAGHRQVRVSRAATVLFGAAGTVLAANVSRIGSLLEIANKLINAFTGPLFGIYLLAMFSRRVASTAALIAGIVGTVTSYYVAYRTPIGFMWPSTFGLVATLVSGWALSAVLPERPRPEALRLTWNDVMRRAEQRGAAL